MKKTINFIQQVFQGKTIHRILFNWQIADHCQSLDGFCLDLAAGKNSGYYRYMSFRPGSKLVRADINKKKDPDQVIDIDKTLPYKDNSVDNVFLFNAIYISKKPNKLIEEIYRILKPQGRLYFNSHLISVEIPEPHDYRRLTSDGIEELLTSFNKTNIFKMGERGTASVHLRNDYYRFRTIKLFAFCTGILLDKLIPKKTKEKYPGPIGYFVVAEK